MGQVRNGQVKVSEHFTWQEAEITNHRNIDNTIPDELELNVQDTANKMEYVREILGRKQLKVILVSSWYRCPELNVAVGSHSTSFHPFGTAVDFICPSFGRPQDVIAELMRYPEQLKFDQLIYEKTWIHIGWDPSGKYRSQVLTLNQDGSYTKGLVV